MNTKKTEAMRAGGVILSAVRNAVIQAVKPGVRFEEFEAIAQSEIKKRGAQPSFSRVPGYHWATCITKNDGLCHGIPRGLIVEDGDVVTVDVGVFYKGYHTDTTDTVAVGKVSPQVQQFLHVSKRALELAIGQVMAGHSVWQISQAMQKEVESHGYGMVSQLTGHGVGKQLHEEPAIPCVADSRDKREILKAGQTIAVEVMSAMGNAFVVFDEDGWTCRTKDGSLSAMFEHTVLVLEDGFEVLTQ